MCSLLSHPVASTTSSSVISFQDAVKRYSGRKTIGPVNLEIRKGDILGFLGPNGSGKTTCIRMLLGLMRPTSGKILVNGLDPIAKHVDALHNVAYSPELPNIQSFLTPSELLTLVLRELQYPSSDRRNEIRRVLELVGLLEYADTKVGKLSKGMVQRLSVAQGLIGSPEILVLDEPMIGLDPAGVSHFREVFRSFSRENHGTVFMSSHIMSEVESLCNAVAIIHSGRIQFRGSIDQVINSVLKHSVIVVESTPLPTATVSRIEEIQGVQDVVVKERRRDDNNNETSIMEVSFGEEGKDRSLDLRAELSSLIVNSGAKLFTIKRADNLLERAYIEALDENRSGASEAS